MERGAGESLRPPFLNMPPLTNIKVLDFTHLLPGEVASTLLSDLGATVLRVERLEKGLNEILPPVVQGESLYYWALHRNQRRLRIDLKKPSGIALALKLARDCDVLVENFRPKALDKLGLGYEALKELNPKIVYCSISGYGSHSKWHDKPGHDLTFVAEAGILSETIDDNGKPVMPGLFVSDYMSGVYGALAVVSALFERQTSGKGKHLEISMFESALSTLSVLATVTAKLDLSDEELRQRYPEALPNHSIYKCADNRYLAAAPVEPKFWKLFLTKIGRLDLLPLDLFDEKDFLIAEIGKTIETKTLEQWMTIFEGEYCCVSPVNTVAEAVDFLPEGRERTMAKLNHPQLGEIFQCTNPIFNLFGKELSGCFDTKAEAKTIFAELKLSETEIERLKHEQAIET